METNRLQSTEAQKEPIQLPNKIFHLPSDLFYYIFQFLSDEDLSSFIVHSDRPIADDAHPLMRYAQSDPRWEQRLLQPIFAYVYVNSIFHNEFGFPILEQKATFPIKSDDKKNTIGQTVADRSVFSIPFTPVRSLPVPKKNWEENIAELFPKGKKEVGNIITSLKQYGIYNFKSLWARYKKLRYFSINGLDNYGPPALKLSVNRLGLDQLVLLSGNLIAIIKWLTINKKRVLRNEPLDDKGHRALHYIALSGNEQAMRYYQQQGFDITVRSWGGYKVAELACLSGSVKAINVCNELKQYIPLSTEGIRSGSRALLYLLTGNKDLAQFISPIAAISSIKATFTSDASLTYYKLEACSSAAQSNNPEMVIAIQEIGWNVCSNSYDTRSMASIASITSNYQTVVACIEADKKPIYLTERNRYGRIWDGEGRAHKLSLRFLAQNPNHQIVKSYTKDKDLYDRVEKIELSKSPEDYEYQVLNRALTSDDPEMLGILHEVLRCPRHYPELKEGELKLVADIQPKQCIIKRRHRNDNLFFSLAMSNGSFITFMTYGDKYQLSKNELVMWRKYEISDVAAGSGNLQLLLGSIFYYNIPINFSSKYVAKNAVAGNNPIIILIYELMGAKMTREFETDYNPPDIINIVDFVKKEYCMSHIELLVEFIFKYPLSNFKKRLIQDLDPKKLSVAQAFALSVRCDDPSRIIQYEADQDSIDNIFQCVKNILMSYANHPKPSGLSFFIPDFYKHRDIAKAMADDVEELHKTGKHFIDLYFYLNLRLLDLLLENKLQINDFLVKEIRYASASVAIHIQIRRKEALVERDYISRFGEPMHLVRRHEKKDGADDKKQSRSRALSYESIFSVRKPRLLHLNAPTEFKTTSNHVKEPLIDHNTTSSLTHTSQTTIAIQSHPQPRLGSRTRRASHS